MNTLNMQNPNTTELEMKSIEVTVDNKIARIQLNRPEKYNSMNSDFWRELPAVVEKINREASARVIVLTSTGKHFCAGMDLDVFADSDPVRHDVDNGRRQENVRHVVLWFQNIFNLLENARMPVLVAVQGACIGGALDMISACDSRYCTEDATFSIEETNIGMTADLGTLQRLPNLLPHGLVRELAYTGRRLSATEAEKHGLVNRVFSDYETMINEVMEIAAEIASRSPLAVTGCKEMINYARDHSISDSLHAMSLWQTGMYQPREDMAETFMAKKEKRAPQFDDLCSIDPVFE